jgi:GcrA cell cycle regulator
MSWDAKDVALLKKLWAVGQSAAQIARSVGCNRNAVCAKLELEVIGFGGVTEMPTS